MNNDHPSEPSWRSLFTLVGIGVVLFLFKLLQLAHERGQLAETPNIFPEWLGQAFAAALIVALVLAAIAAVLFAVGFVIVMIGYLLGIGIRAGRRRY